MSAPRYVQRLARLPQVFAYLADRPDGVAFDDLAAEFGLSADELREDLLAYYSADVGEAMFGLARPETLEFLGPEGDLSDPNTAFAVQVIGADPMGDIGVEHVSAADLALIYTAATALADLEPDDADLASAIDVIAESMLDPAATITRSGVSAGPVASLRSAQEAHRAVRIEYSRAWRAGVDTRVIHPYAVTQTRRGWEVDAGPVRPDGSIRSYLVGNIRSMEVLDDTFDAPGDLAELLAAQRRTTRVRMQIPHDASWAAFLYAERIHRVDEDDLSVTIDLDLLPPVDRRVGLITLAGPDGTRVLNPPELALSVADLAAELLAHHQPPPFAG